MATAAQVETILKELLRRWNSGGRATDLPDQRVVHCVITDLDLRYQTTFDAGVFSRLRAVRNGSAGGDVVVAVSSADLIALSEGRLSPVFAFLSGRLKIEANARDLGLLRGLFQ